MELAKRDDYKSVILRFTELGIDETTALKEVDFAMQHINKNNQLQKADPKSKLQAVANVAQCGLTLNPISKQAYLVPRWDNKLKATVCILEPSYMGLVKLLTDSGSVKNVEAFEIYEGDEIEVDLASDKKIIKHVPYLFTGKEKGKFISVYSRAVLMDGSISCEIMSAEDIEYIRGKSDSYKAYEAGKIKTCTWESDKPEMRRKSVIKRHYKYLPKTDQAKFIEQAIQLDHDANGFRQEVGVGSMNYIDSLMFSAGIDGKVFEKVEYDISQIQYEDQAAEMIKYLKENQADQDIVTPGQIQKKLDTLEG